MDINNKLVLRVLNSPWANDIKTPVDLSKTDKFYPIYQSFDNNFIYLKGEAIHTATTKDSKLVINKTNGEDIEVDLSSVNTLQNVLDNGSVASLTGSNENIEITVSEPFSSKKSYFQQNKDTILLEHTSGGTNSSVVELNGSELLLSHERSVGGPNPYETHSSIKLDSNNKIVFDIYDDNIDSNWGNTKFTLGRHTSTLESPNFNLFAFGTKRHYEQSGIINIVGDEQLYIGWGYHTTQGEAKAIRFGVKNDLDLENSKGVVVYDEEDEFGFKYYRDYSHSGTTDPLWIPSWGAVTELTSNFAIVGTYTDNYVPRWNATTNTLESGTIQDNGSNVHVGGSPDSTAKLKVSKGSGIDEGIYVDVSNGGGNGARIEMKNNSGTTAQTGLFVRNFSNSSASGNIKGITILTETDNTSKTINSVFGIQIQNMDLNSNTTVNNLYQLLLGDTGSAVKGTGEFYGIKQNATNVKNYFAGSMVFANGAGTAGHVWVSKDDAGTGGWKSITEITDLQSELDDKLDTTTFESYTGSVKDVHVSSGTVNAQDQSVTFTNTTGGTFNLENAAVLFTDKDSYVTGGTYNPNTGVVTYKTSTGFTFGVSGFTTGMTDTYVTNGKLEGTKLKLTKSDGGAVSDIELSGLQIWDKNNTSAYYNTGNVGIGTDSPDGPLHVETPTGTATIRVKSSGNTSSAFHAINKDGNAITLGINGSNLKLNSSGSLTNNHLVINSSGNVGINTGSPSQKLEVNGVTKSDVFAVRNDVNTRIISPQGAEYENDKANQPGRIKITAPADISSSSQATQFKSTIKVFYTEGEFDLHVSCYIQNNGSSTKPMVWQYAWIDSPPDGNNKYNFKVRLYFDEDNKFAIAIGDETSRWGRLKVVVTDVILAWNNDSIDEWSTGWSIKLDNYLDEEGLPKAVLDDDISTNNVTPITTISATQANNWGKAGNSLKYDGGDVNISSGSLIINDYILPSSKGTNGQLLKLKDDNGNLEWVDASSLQTQSIWTETVDTATYDGNIVANSLSSQSSNTCRVINPEGATYFKSETSNGSIIIRLPQGWTNSHINMKVKIYEYSSDEDITLNISGYNYKNDGHTNGGYWAKTTAWIEGSPEDVDNHNIPVHFGYDKELEKCIIFLGGEDFSWGTFLSVYVTDVQVSGNYTTDGVKASDVSRWNSAWYIFRSDNWSTTKIGDTETNRFITNANTTVENTQTNNWIRNTDDSIIYNKGTVNIGVRPISEDNLKLFATSDSSNEDKNIIPEIGISGSTHTALGYGSSTTNSYGIAMGTLQASGRSWIQSKRFRGADGHPDDLYDLLLNPLGGDVGIGTETPTEKLEVAGNIFINDTSSSLKINNYTLPAADGTDGQVLKTNGNGVVSWQNDTDTSIWSVNAGTATYNGNIIADSISSVASDNVRILNPAGGEYSSGTKKGYIVITLPQGWTNTMISMTVKIFDYTQHEHATLNLAGYTYAGSFTSTNTAIAQWTATSAWVEGNPIDEHNFKVRFGYDNAKDKCVIVIGNVDTTWSIPKVYITDLQVAANNYQSSKWNDGWDIIISDTVDISAGRTSDTGIWIDDTHHSTQAHNWVRNTDNSIKYQSGNVKILGGNSLTINDYTFPATKGGAGQVLKTDANGNVTWQNDIDTDTNTSIWSENTSYTRNSDNSNISGAYYNTGNVGIGTDKPQSKLHLEGSNFTDSSIRFLNTGANNEDYWVIGSRAFSSWADGFEIGRKADSTGGKLYITNAGNVSIGNGYEPTNKLEVAGSALISKSNSASDILSVESIYGNLTYGGASGVGDSTNNLILKHKNSGGAGTTSSTIGLKSANDESSISLTSYYTTNGTNISYNALVMNAGDSQVNIIAADNNAENSILSIQADESISFQSSINAAGSWPDDSKKTMTIDLTNDKVIVDGNFRLNNGTQSNGKVLISDDDGNATWGYNGLKPKYKLFSSLTNNYKISEINTFNKFWFAPVGSTEATVELPDVTFIANKSEVVVKHIGGTQKIIINPPSGTKIDNFYGNDIVQISDGDSITFYCDGTNWYIKSHYVNVFGTLPSQPLDPVETEPGLSMVAYVKVYDGDIDTTGDGFYDTIGARWEPLSPDGVTVWIKAYTPREVQIITSDGSPVDLFNTVRPECVKISDSASGNSRYGSGEIFTVSIDGTQACSEGNGTLEFRHIYNTLLQRSVNVSNGR